MMESKWFLRNKKADFLSLGQKFHIDPVITRIITNRGVEGEEAVNKYLNATLVDLYDPHLLKDADKGADLLIKKVKEKKKIRAITDYDIDGVQSSVKLLVCEAVHTRDFSRELAALRLTNTVNLEG